MTITSILALLIITTASGSEHAHLMLSHHCRQDVAVIRAMAEELPAPAYLDKEGERIISLECRPYRMGAVS